MSGYGRGRGAKRGWWPKNKLWHRNQPQQDDEYYQDDEWVDQEFYEDEPIDNNRHVWINEDARLNQHYNQPNSSFAFQRMEMVQIYNWKLNCVTSFAFEPN
jgi:hypothetical protein